MSRRFPVLLIALAAVAACKPNTPPPVTEPPPSPPPVATPTDPLPAPEGPTPATPSGSFVWPASVGAFGDGYPRSGDPCRRLGEADATGEYLDHTRDLVGCPGGPETAAARAIVAGGGRVVGQHDGVTMISVYAGERP